MFVKLNKIALALALGLGTIASTSLPVEAMPVTVGASVATDSLVTVDYINQNQMKGNHNWSRARDGNRCRVASGNCRHFYRGYYYETPWWAFPLIIGGAIAGQNHYSPSHDQWCRAHHRFYHQRTNSYMGRDGKWHTCR